MDRSEAGDYRPRRPETTLLYGALQQHLESWLVGARRDERSVPRFVHRELRSFLDCGIPAHGFLRVHCDACGLDRVVPFSCKGRGFCPSCGGRRMADTAAHLVDRVLPRAPVRQWVLSLPFGLRYRLGYDRELTADVLQVFVRAVFVSLRRRTRLPDERGEAHCGAVTFVQRFGGALNLNVHFHTLALDGAWRIGADGTPRFRPAPPPTDAELERVLARVTRGLARLLERRGLGDEPDALSEEDPLLAGLLAAAVQGRAASGSRSGQRVMRFGDRVDVEEVGVDAAEPTTGLARCNGFSLHAGVSVPANDRRRLERLCRYTARPPVATDRLSALSDGRLLYGLRHRWRDGTTHVAFTPTELIDRLAALVPPPRFHTVRYHGVLASRSKHRAAIVPGDAARLPAAGCGCGKAIAPPSGQAAEHASRESEEPAADDVPPAAVQARPSRYYSWPELMRRIFEVDVLRCPRCHAGPMRILAAIHPPTTHAILKSLGLPARAPPIAKARVSPPDWTVTEPPGPRYRQANLPDRGRRSAA